MGHGRNKYNSPPNFKSLAEKFPELAPFIKDGSINFSSEEAVKALNRALLAVDFDIDIQIPSGNLCPTIANRLDYLHLVEDLLESTSLDFRKEAVRGYDMYCIYPLLGSRLHSNWTFIATEIDPESYRVACENVKRNGLEDRIEIVQTKSQEEALFRALDNRECSFVICNPPFYCSEEDILSRKAKKLTGPSTSLKYSISESIYPGGEVAFIERIIKESEDLKDKVAWFTTMIGLKESITPLQAKLNLLKPRPMVKIMSSQVGKTKRWVLAWSFRNPRKRSLELVLARNIVDPKEWLDERLAELEILEKEVNHFQTCRNSWSRKSRRAQSRGVDLPSLTFSFHVDVCGQTLVFIPDQPDEHCEEFNGLVNHLKGLLRSGHSPFGRQ